LSEKAFLAQEAVGGFPNWTKKGQAVKARPFGGSHDGAGGRNRTDMTVKVGGFLRRRVVRQRAAPIVDTPQ